MAKRVHPLRYKCITCGALPQKACHEEGWPLSVPHEARWVKAEEIEKPSTVTRATNPLTLVCPRCKAMPNRQCIGPPPYRDPKPTHKARYLAAERVDNVKRKARGLRKQPSKVEKPVDERPWVKDGQTRKREVEVLTAVELRRIREARDRARARREAAERRLQDGQSG